MGAWGVEPFENDSALDWLCAPCNAIEKALYCHRRNGKYGSTGQHEALAAAVMVKCMPSIAASFTRKSQYKITFAAEALTSLKLLEKDEQFVKAWVRPKTYLAVLAREKRALQRIVRAQRRIEKLRLDKLERTRRRKKRASDHSRTKTSPNRGW